MKNIIKYKSNKNIVYACQYHVIWCSKYRRKVLINGVDERLKVMIQEVILELEAELLELEMIDDHVPLFVSVDPPLGIHKLVKRIKGKSSRLLREEFPWLKRKIPTLWTNSYFVSTVGGATLDVVKQYIEEQKNV